MQSSKNREKLSRKARGKINLKASIYRHRIDLASRCPGSRRRDAQTRISVNAA